ncbi:MAG: DUF885 domain-containing protein [Planctomycetaceae bacterium]|nr:DUF885 domain-containing protein [Planctomycetaceae bacterium]
MIRSDLRAPVAVFSLLPLLLIAAQARAAAPLAATVSGYLAGALASGAASTALSPQNGAASGFVAAPPSAPQETPSSEATARFDAIAREYEAWRLTVYPEMALRRGDETRAGELTDASIAGIAKRHAQLVIFLDDLRAIDATQLGAGDRLDHDLLVRELALSVDGHRFNGWMMPVGGRFGPHTDIPQMGDLATFADLDDYEAYAKRLSGVPGMIGQTIEVMRRGLEEGVVPPSVTIVDVPAQIRAARQGVGDALRKPFAKMPRTISDDDRARVRAEVERWIDPIDTAMTEFEAFFANEYLPKCRASIGASAMKDGAAWYAHQLRVHTTTDMSAREIHDTGLAEVARIRAEMMQVIARTDWFAADPARAAMPEDERFAAFIAYLRSDPRFYCTTAEELLTRYREVCKRIDPKLPALFGTLPRLTYGVREIPRFMAPTQTTAYYQPGSPQRGEPGWFYANTYALDQRPKYEFIPLSLHEAVPGHHFQIALAQELAGVREFRKDLDSTAFTEGWALYAERLGIEMGFFEDPYDDFGRLLYEMWRSCRLVVDTGMHAFGWERERAIEFMKRNTALSELNIVNEVDRYIGWPGQACGYKIGELVIRRLRAKAESALGKRFDIRRFHDTVLLQGPLPLDVLERNVDAWIAAELARGA